MLWRWQSGNYQSGKKQAAYAYLGEQVPKEPEYSYLAEYLVDAYHQIARARRYEQGVLLPLSLHDIAAFADSECLPVSKRLLKRAVFAIDNDVLEKAYRRK